MNSTSEDTVFINFSDHGGASAIAFPNDFLLADDLYKIFDYMHTNKMYKDLVFYLEACESGSMFVDLPTNWNIYATSASGPYESSWAAYCD